MTIDPLRIEVIDDRVASIMRTKSPQEKIELASAMWRSARMMVLSSLRQAHPDWSAERIHAEAVRRLSHGAA